MNRRPLVRVIIATGATGAVAPLSAALAHQQQSACLPACLAGGDTNSILSLRAISHRGGIFTLPPVCAAVRPPRLSPSLSLLHASMRPRSRARRYDHRI